MRLTSLFQNLFLICLTFHYFIVNFPCGKLRILFSFVLKLLTTVYWLSSLLLFVYICLQVFVRKKRIYICKKTNHCRWDGM